MKKALIAVMLLGLAFGCRSAGTVKQGVDFSKYQTIVVNEFSLEGAAIQDHPEVKGFADTLPPRFADMAKQYLKQYNVASNVVLASEAKGMDKSAAYMVIEGSFTKITAGSTAARILVGFGAGASTVGAKWTVMDGKTGEELGSFEKNSHTAGGYRGITALDADSRTLASDLAKLMLRNFRQ